MDNIVSQQRKEVCQIQTLTKSGHTAWYKSKLCVSHIGIDQRFPHFIDQRTRFRVPQLKHTLDNRQLGRCGV